MDFEVQTLSVAENLTKQKEKMKEIMDYDEKRDDDDDDDEDVLLWKVPEQSNQSCTEDGIRYIPDVGRRYGSNLLGINYMYRTMLMDQSMSNKKDTFNDVMKGKRVEEMVRHGDRRRTSRIIEVKEENTEPKFLYNLGSISKEQVEMDTHCEWLDSRLALNQIINDDIATVDQLVLHLKFLSINVANDLMIYYHTDSEFALQLLRMESYNLLTLLKDSRLQSVMPPLIDGFSDYLISIIKDSEILKNNAKSLNITIPFLAEKIMNNYALIQHKRPTLKVMFHDIPKVVFYSFFVPIYIVMDCNHINAVLDKKIISLQRRYFCKVILDGPFLKDTPSNKKSEFFRFDIFLDYQFNYWVVIKNELLKWMNSFVRSMFTCNIDKVCVSYATQNFFCCDEIQNLMKRQHLLREVDIDFAKVIKWSKIHQVDRSIL